MREILIKSIYVDSNNIIVKPTMCPGKDRNDIVRDKNTNPTCVLTQRVCAYLDEVNYDVDKHDEIIECRIS